MPRRGASDRPQKARAPTLGPSLESVFHTSSDGSERPLDGWNVLYFDDGGTAKEVSPLPAVGGWGGSVNRMFCCMVPEYFLSFSLSSAAAGREGCQGVQPDGERGCVHGVPERARQVHDQVGWCEAPQGFQDGWRVGGCRASGR